MRGAKARRRASVMPEDLAELLALRDHSTNPERLFQSTDWKELLLPPTSCTWPSCGIVFTP